jgi:hypothetical protein
LEAQSGTPAGVHWWIRWVSEDVWKASPKTVTAG